MASEHTLNAPRDGATVTEGAGSDALLRLRESIERAAETIERLREENVRLATRLAELADEPLLREAGERAPQASLFDEDAGAMRQKIEGFIEALDRVLAERSRAPMEG